VIHEDAANSDVVEQEGLKRWGGRSSKPPLE